MQLDRGRRISTAPLGQQRALAHWLLWGRSMKTLRGGELGRGLLAELLDGLDDQVHSAHQLLLDGM